MIDQLAARIADLRNLLLMLDFDGTLVPFHDNPDSVYPSDELKRLLVDLSARDGIRLIIVTGRGHADLHRRLVLPDATFICSHGAEIDGRLCPMPDGFAEEFERAREMLTTLVKTCPECRIERKPAGLTLHTRRATSHTAARVVDQAIQLIESDLRPKTLIWARGSQVLELRPRDVGKGRAVSDLLAKPSNKGHFPIYIGDDLADEPAFDAVGPSGLSIRVRNGSDRETTAHHELPDPDAVVDFLDHIRRLHSSRRGNAPCRPIHEFS